MQQLTYIKAIYMPEVHDPEVGMFLDSDKAESVTIVAFTPDATIAIFVDYGGKLRRGYLNEFSECVFVTN